MKGPRARRLGAEAELIRADAHWLAVMYADTSIPFALNDIDAPLPYRSSPRGIDRTSRQD